MYEKKYDDAEEAGQYTIRSVDIDLAGHMNNVNYVRAMLGCYDSAELKKMDIKEIELNYISQSYEGNTLRFVTRQAEDGLEVGAIGPEGKAVFAAKII